MKKQIRYILIGILAILVAFVLLVLWFFGIPSEPESQLNPEKAKAAMAQMQAKSEQIYSQNETYNDVSCVYDEVMAILCKDVEKRIESRPTIHTVKDEYCAYIAYVKLDVNRYYCIDSTGNREETTTDPSSLGYCDGITFTCPH